MGGPGKRRTWWHPLLVRLLTHLMGKAYEVQDEVLVGRMPLRVDILLIRREQGQLSAAAERDLGALVPLLNRFTLVEFKGPTDALERGDLAQLIGCAFLWHSQQAGAIPPHEVTLVVLAPRLNDPFREDLRLFGWEVEEREAGVFAIDGAPWKLWVIETDVMAQRGQPVLSLVSHALLDDPAGIMKALRGTDCGPLLSYAMQQIQQFATLGKEFAMQHTETEYLGEWTEDLKTAVLELIPPQDRLRGLSPEDLRKIFSPEELLRGLPPEDRLRGLPPEDRLRGLSDEELDQLRELLEQKREG